MSQTTSARRAERVPDQVRALLRAQELCVLATVFVDIPHLSLMGYTVSDDCLRLYMATAPDTKKVANIRRNPNVAVMVDTRDAAVSGGPGEAVMVKGRCRVLPDGPEREAALAELAERDYMAGVLGNDEVAVLEVRAQSFHHLRGTQDATYVEMG